MLLPAPLAATAKALRTNELDLLAYINDICARIDAAEPHIQALLPQPQRRERLLAQAEALQAHFPDPASRPPLYGIPVGVKDLFNVDGFPTQAGSQLRASLFDGPEAVCVRALRQAGALIVGKTVSTEFAYFEPGPTRNPHNLAQTPGGSSSGSAAAVAAGLCPLALGTQTIGSTIRAAAFCGIVGFKPSYDRIPTAGLIKCAESLDTACFFTQDVAGVDLAASLLCDNWRRVEPAHKPVLGVPEGAYLAQASAEGLAAFERQLRSLAAAGYSVMRVAALEQIEAINRRHLTIVCAEMAQVHASWFAQYESLYRPRTAAAIREGQSVDAENLTRAPAGRIQLRAALEALMDRYGIDVWVAPAAPGSAPEGIHTTGNAVINLPGTHADMPVLSLPAGRAENGLPLGLQCVGAFMADEQLVAWAADLAEVLASLP